MWLEKLSNSARSAGRRIRDGNFNESDVRSVLIELREKGCPFLVKEFGDMVAHPARDRGDLFERAKLWYGKGAFLIEAYDIKRISDFSSEWWFDSFVLFQLSKVRKNELRDITGVSFSAAKSLLKSLISSPASLRANLIVMNSDLQNILYFICQEIDANPFYKQESVRSISKFIALTVCGAKHINAIDNVECCLLLMLHKLRFDLPQGNVATFSMQVDYNDDDLINGFLGIVCMIWIKMRNGIPVWLGSSFLVSSVKAAGVMKYVPLIKINEQDITYDFNADITFSVSNNEGLFLISV